MFLKRVKGGSKNNPIYYFQIAESYRSDRGPKHKTICTVGRMDEVIRDGTLKRFMEGISRHLENVAVIDLKGGSRDGRSEGGQA